LHNCSFPSIWRFIVKQAFLLLTLLLFTLSSALAEIPHTLSYQAVLTNPDGTPKADGLYEVTFRLYDVASGGAELWTETQSLQVRRGLFNAVLGAITPFGDNVPFTQAYWLSLQLAPEPELTPRLPLTSVGYSLGPWSTTSPARNGAGQKSGNAEGQVDNVFYNGYVSIGTNTVYPGYLLNVNGGAVMSTGGSGGTIAFGTPSTETGMTISGSARADVRFDGSSLKLLAGAAGGPPPSTNGVLITTAGNVGIGSAAPLAGYRLDVGGQTVIRAGGNGGGFVAFGTPNSETGMTISGNNRADVRFDGASLKLVAGPGGVGPPSSANGVAITTAGNVGIGTANPAAKLEVIGRTRTGSLEVTAGSDLAEPFDTEVDVTVEPGSVMVIDAANPGRLKMSGRSYDTGVAGIVSGAGGVKPGITLQQEGVLEGSSLVAIAGRVYCKADARGGPIQPGDLLTTSDVKGHAMKATDRERSHGAIIGKAMTALTEGTGLVLVLVNLQ
jgi:hypothetical protein